MGEFPNKDTQFSSENQPDIPGGVNKKGSKHLSTHIQEMLNDEKFELKLKDGTLLKEVPIYAIIKTAIAKSVSGDTRAMEWLAKHGYGEKLNIEFENDLFKEMKLKIEVVKSDNINIEREAADSAESTE